MDPLSVVWLDWPVHDQPPRRRRSLRRLCCGGVAVAGPPLTRVHVLERTSGDEHEGQDAAAQLRQTTHRARERGYEVLGSEAEEDVPGDTPWPKRKRLRAALERARRDGAAVLVREATRLWRGDPAEGLQLIAGIPDLVVLDDPMFDRRAGAWVDDSDAAYLTRVIVLWSAWTTKRRDEARSRLAMQEIVAGRRPTKSGKPHHRPPIEYDPAHLEAARAVYQRTGSVTEAHREFLRLRGVDDAKDPRTKKARSISRAKVGELLGVYTPASVRKGSVSERGAAPAAPNSVGMEPLPDNEADP